MTKEEREAIRITQSRADLEKSGQFRQGLAAADLSHEESTSMASEISLSPVRRIDPRLLAPNPRNNFAPLPTDELNRLSEDIKRRGIQVPLIVIPLKRSETGEAENLGGVILSGHTRHSIALHHGLASVPVQYTDRQLSADEEMHYLISDNFLRRQLTTAEKSARLAELYPELREHRSAGRPRKNGDTVSPFPAKTIESIAIETATNPRTMKRHAAIIRVAAENAAARGDERPTADDFQYAINERSKRRKEPSASTTDKPPFNIDTAVMPEPDKKLAQLLKTALARIGNDPANVIAESLVHSLTTEGLVKNEQIQKSAVRAIIPGIEQPETRI